MIISIHGATRRRYSHEERPSLELRDSLFDMEIEK